VAGIETGAGTSSRSLFRRRGAEASRRRRAAAAFPSLLLALLLVLLSLAPARAQSFEEAAGLFAKDSFAETTKAIEALARSGDPRAPAVIEALADRRLSVAGGMVFLTDTAGATVDAVTGAPVTAPADAAPVRLNNRVRNALQKAMAASRFAAADPRQRLEAAEAAIRARDPAALPAIEAAIAAEGDARVKAAFERAAAAIRLADGTRPEAERLAAVALLEAQGGPETLALLRQIGEGATGALRLRIDGAVAALEQRQQMLAVGQTIWFGISLGSVLLLAAIGLAITFGVMGVINMAHGEMVMIGAYVTFLVQETMRAFAPGILDWSLLIALPLAFLVAALVGVAIERGVIRFLYGRPLETLLATFGISLMLQQGVRTLFGPTNREVAAPSYMSGAFEFFGLQITYGRLWIVVFALVVFAALLLLLRATSLGLQMRAVTQNRRMASAMGIRTGFVDSMTFALGSGIAGVAGVALSQIDNVSPNLGQNYIIDSFMVVVFGGVGNLWGTLVAAFSLGVANKVLEPFAGAVLAKILILVLLILFIQKRPRGLFALKGRAVEA
jgi:urea transport system permease protein